MGILLSVFLPLSLAFIMFSLGLGLTVARFRPGRGAAEGVFCRRRLADRGPADRRVPAFCNGVPSAARTGGRRDDPVLLSGWRDLQHHHQARGRCRCAFGNPDRRVVSLISVITVPLLVAWAADHFMGRAAPHIDVTALALAMFAITAVPVAIGVALRQFATSSCRSRIEAPASRIALVLFVVIVIGALAANWSLFVANLVLLGPLLVVLNVVLLMLGLGIAGAMGLDRADGIAIAIETGVQNSTLGITVGSLIVEAASGLPPFSLPSGVYGITMYFVAVPFIYLMRRRAQS